MDCRPLISAVFLTLVSVPAWAQTEDCAPAPEDSLQLDGLFSLLQSAPNAAAAQPIVNGMWHVWLKAPDPMAQELLDEGLAQIRYANYPAAIAFFDHLIAHCPAYAEGYNQRAYAHFLAGNYEAALVDLEHALARMPRHLGALTGKARTLLKLGRDGEGHAVLRDALALNPWLAERHRLPQPKGIEL